MQRKIWLSFALAGFLAMGCRPDPEVGDALCSDQIDNDEDGNIDCADVGCVEEPVCQAEICTDGVDNNGNGLIDCADTVACVVTQNPACVESNCGDNADNDNDTLVDCDDSDCDANPLCDVIPEVCNNNQDDDGDGDADCADTDCAGAANCQGPEDCDNDLDDDADGDIDCADSECTGGVGCDVEAGNCTDGLDNDGNTFIDCNDFDCSADPACGGSAEICSGGIDEDNDTFIDCNDFDCTGDPACGGGAEVCTGGLDEDGDSFIDCDDFDCDADPACALVGGVLEIQDVQLNPVDNTIVTIENVFVTAVRGAAGENVTLILQEPQGDTITGLTYPERAGIGVFIPIAQSANLTIPAAGQCVTITGAVGDFNGQTQLDNVSVLTIIANAATCGTAPTPFVIPSAANPAVTFADIATDLDPVAAQNQEGTLTEVYEGVLVTVVNVRVVADVDNFDEFPLAEQSNAAGPRLNIDDFFVNFEDISGLGLTVNQNLASVTGIYNDVFNFKIQIRQQSDITP